MSSRLAKSTSKFRPVKKPQKKAGTPVPSGSASASASGSVPPQAAPLATASSSLDPGPGNESDPATATASVDHVPAVAKDTYQPTPALPLAEPQAEAEPPAAASVSLPVLVPVSAPTSAPSPAHAPARASSAAAPTLAPSQAPGQAPAPAQALAQNQAQDEAQASAPVPVQASIQAAPAPTPAQPSAQAQAPSYSPSPAAAPSIASNSPSQPVSTTAAQPPLAIDTSLREPPAAPSASSNGNANVQNDNVEPAASIQADGGSSTLEASLGSAAPSLSDSALALDSLAPATLAPAAAITSPQARQRQQSQRIPACIPRNRSRSRPRSRPPPSSLAALVAATSSPPAPISSLSQAQAPPPPPSPLRRDSSSPDPLPPPSVQEPPSRPIRASSFFSSAPNSRNVSRHGTPADLTASSAVHKAKPAPVAAAADAATVGPSSLLGALDTLDSTQASEVLDPTQANEAVDSTQATTICDSTQASHSTLDSSQATSVPSKSQFQTQTRTQLDSQQQQEETSPQAAAAEQGRRSTRAKTKTPAKEKPQGRSRSKSQQRQKSVETNQAQGSPQDQSQIQGDDEEPRERQVQAVSEVNANAPSPVDFSVHELINQALAAAPELPVPHVESSNDGADAVQAPSGSTQPILPALPEPWPAATEGQDTPGPSVASSIQHPVADGLLDLAAAAMAAEDEEEEESGALSESTQSGRKRRGRSTSKKAIAGDSNKAKRKAPPPKTPAPAKRAASARSKSWGRTRSTGQRTDAEEDDEDSDAQNAAQTGAEGDIQSSGTRAEGADDTGREGVEAEAGIQAGDQAEAETGMVTGEKKKRKTPAKRTPRAKATPAAAAAASGGGADADAATPAAKKTPAKRKTTAKQKKIMSSHFLDESGDETVTEQGQTGDVAMGAAEGAEGEEGMTEKPKAVKKKRKAPTKAVLPDGTPKPKRVYKKRKKSTTGDLPIESENPEGEEELDEDGVPINPEPWVIRRTIPSYSLSTLDIFAAMELEPIDVSVEFVTAQDVRERTDTEEEDEEEDEEEVDGNGNPAVAVPQDRQEGDINGEGMSTALVRKKTPVAKKKKKVGRKLKDGHLPAGTGAAASSGEEEEDEDGNEFAVSTRPWNPLGPIDPTITTMKQLAKDTGRGRLSGRMIKKMGDINNRREIMKKSRERMKLRQAMREQGLPEDVIQRRLDLFEAHGHELEDDSMLWEAADAEENIGRRIAFRDNTPAHSARGGSEATPAHYSQGGSPENDENRPLFNPEANSEDEDDNRSRAQTYNNEDEDDGIMESQYAPQMRFINGEFVLDEASTQIVRGAEHETYATVEDTHSDRKINSSTWSKRAVSSRWTMADTNLFYDGLMQFGTDFELISRMFTNRTRRQIKAKFVREERLNLDKLEDALKGKKKIDTNFYERMTKLENIADGVIPADPMAKYYEDLPTASHAVRLESNREPTPSEESDLAAILRKKKEDTAGLNGLGPLEEGAEAEHYEPGEDGIPEGDEDMDNYHDEHIEGEYAEDGQEGEYQEQQEGGYVSRSPSPEADAFPLMGGVQLKVTG